MPWMERVQASGSYPKGVVSWPSPELSVSSSWLLLLAFLIDSAAIEDALYISLGHMAPESMQSTTMPQNKTNRQIPLSVVATTTDHSSEAQRLGASLRPYEALVSPWVK